jgi:CRISPR-associated protein Cas1
MELVLNTFGTSLSKDNEGFVIIHSDGKQRIPAEGITSIQISKGAQITSDAVILAIEKEIEILFTNKEGSPIGRVWSPKYGSVSTIRKGQLNFSFSKDATEWIKEIICKKIENQQALLLMMHTTDIKLIKQEKRVLQD